MSTRTVAEARCVSVADTIVPNYRHGSRAYSCGGHVAKTWQAAYDGAAAVLAGPLPADVRRLVIAARVVAWEDEDEAALQELREASELFADRVEWEDQPEDEPELSATPVEGLTSGEERCGKCNGSGHCNRAYSSECDACGGSGYIASPKATATASVREDDEKADRTADEAVDFVFDRLAKKLGLAEWQVVEGSEEWEGDVSATLHRLLVDAGIIDDETGALATLTDSGTADTHAGSGEGRG